MRNIKSAVVTGPTGAIGIALCAELAAHGVKVYAVVRPNSPRAAAVPSHPLIETVACDIGEIESLPEKIKCADAFYHFAWAHTIGAGRNDMPAQTDNIKHTLSAVRCAKSLGCEVFIGAGSQAEYGRADGVLTPDTPCFPENGYGIAKHAAGRMSRIEAHTLGLDHIWVRILSVYGPGDGPDTMVSSVINQLFEKKKPALTKGEQMWDYLYSGDAARAFRLIGGLGVNGRTYVLGGGKAIPLREYIEIIRDSIDPSLPLGFGEIPYGAQQVMHLQADISVLTADTGFVPTVDFESGIRNIMRGLRR